MNAKENALRIIHFDHPAYVMESVPVYALKYHGTDHEGFQGGGHDCPLGSRWVDIWGTEWHKEHEGVMGFPRGNPLPHPDALRGYPWPDPHDERVCGRIAQLAAAFPGGDCFLAGRHRDTLWEKAYMLVGMENLMDLLLTPSPPSSARCCHRIMDFELGIAETYLASRRRDGRASATTWARSGPAAGSPDIVHEFLVPEYDGCSTIQDRNGSSSTSTPAGASPLMLETFMELGVNVLEPVQATANDLDRLRAITQGADGAAAARSARRWSWRVRLNASSAEVRRRIWQLGREGGYFCGPDQGMPYPPEHLEALREAIARFGHYPLRPD